MKYLFVTIITYFLWTNIFSQSPEAMSFQAVIRDANSNLVQNTQVGIQISVLQGSINGISTFTERHTPMTNDNGLVTFEIGNGTTITGSFANIDWSNGPYFLRTETDLTGGTAYTIPGVSQLLSVPYALHAATAGSVNEVDPLFGSSVAAGITGVDTTNWNIDLVNDADADPGNEIQTIALQGDTLSISNGNSVIIPFDSSIWYLNNDTVYYNDGNVGIGTSSPVAKLVVDGDFIRRVAVATGNGPDDQLDNGRINSRSLTFSKKHANTKLRISYTDNFRTYHLNGAGHCCQWEIRIDGVSCSQHPLTYSNHVSQAADNTHGVRTYVGYCEGVNVGTHQIQIWVSTCSGYPASDCYTGYGNSHWVIEVEEVF